MNSSEFTFIDQRKTEYAFPYWKWSKSVPTRLGEFQVEIFDDDAPQNTPDSEKLSRAEALVRYVEAHGDFILDIVFGSYRSMLNQPEWLDICEVPKDLTKDTVKAHVRQKLSLSVTRWVENGEVSYSATVGVVPLWDEEHGLSMSFSNGTIELINGEPFRLNAGVLEEL
jgi:hypothetical protein